MARETGKLARVRATARGFNKRHQALGISTRRVFLRAEAKRATLSVNPAGTNNGILYSAYYHGTAGNSIRVAHVVPGTANAVLSVSVSGNDITVNVGTTAVAGTPASTANQVIAAVNAHAAASKLVFAQSNEGDGTGVVAAQALTALSGGQ